MGSINSDFLKPLSIDEKKEFAVLSAQIREFFFKNRPDLLDKTIATA